MKKLLVLTGSILVLAGCQQVETNQPKEMGSKQSNIVSQERKPTENAEKPLFDDKNYTPYHEVKITYLNKANHVRTLKSGEEIQGLRLSTLRSQMFKGDESAIPKATMKLEFVTDKEGEEDVVRFVTEKDGKYYTYSDKRITDANGNKQIMDMSLMTNPGVELLQKYVDLNDIKSKPIERKQEERSGYYD